MKQKLCCITVHRPWAYAIAHLGKDIENRTWACPLEPGRLLGIHAGQRWDDPGAEWVRSNIWDELSGETASHPMGIIAIATFTGNVTASDSVWFQGPIGWGLTNVVPLPEPIPCRGYQRLWEIPDDILPEVREQYEIAINPCRTLDGAIAWFMENYVLLQHRLPLPIEGGVVFSLEPLLERVQWYKHAGTAGDILDETEVRAPIERIFKALR